VIVIAAAVGIGEASSLVEAFGANAFAVGAAAFLMSAAVVWHVRGRPRWPHATLRPLVDSRIVQALGAVIAASVAYELLLVLLTPPNNWDSMTYHLPPAVEWRRCSSSRPSVNCVPGRIQNLLSIVFSITSVVLETSMDATSGSVQFSSQLRGPSSNGVTVSTGGYSPGARTARVGHEGRVGPVPPCPAPVRQHGSRDRLRGICNH
jgi:hypothetical protein